MVCKYNSPGCGACTGDNVCECPVFCEDDTSKDVDTMSVTFVNFPDSFDAVVHPTGVPGFTIIHVEINSGAMGLNRLYDLTKSAFCDYNITEVLIPVNASVTTYPRIPGTNCPNFASGPTGPTITTDLWLQVIGSADYETTTPKSYSFIAGVNLVGLGSELFLLAFRNVLGCEAGALERLIVDASSCAGVNFLDGTQTATVDMTFKDGLCPYDCEETTCSGGGAEQIKKITVSVSNIPDTLTKFRYVPTPNILGTPYWEKMVLTGMSFANATYVLTKNGICLFSTATAESAGSGTVQFFNNDGGCPGTTLLGTGTVTDTELSITVAATVSNFPTQNSWNVGITVAGIITYNYAAQIGLQASDGRTVGTFVNCSELAIQGTIENPALINKPVGAICPTSFISGPFGTVTPSEN